MSKWLVLAPEVHYSHRVVDAENEVTKKTTTWDVWVAGEKTSYASADEALRAYARAIDERGEAIVSLERDGWRALDACRAVPGGGIRHHPSLDVSQRRERGR